MEKETITLSTNDFLCSDWRTLFESGEVIDYWDLNRGFESLAKTYRDAGCESKEIMMSIFSDICSMRLDSSSLNNPFQSSIVLEDRRSLTGTDLSNELLEVLKKIASQIDEPLLKSRISDLLWIHLKPKKIEHAYTAISSYRAHAIKESTWSRNVNTYFERAITLALQVRAKDQLNAIRDNLLRAFRVSLEDKEYSLYPYSITNLLNKKGLCEGVEKELADSLIQYGASVMQAADQKQLKSDYQLAQRYFQLAEKLFASIRDESKKLSCMVSYAECYELEANSRLNRGNGNQGVARSFYEDALQAYRRIPNKYRTQFNIDEKLKTLQKRIEETGKESLGEMASFSHSEDITEVAQDAARHVSNKPDLPSALIAFSGFKALDTEAIEKQLQSQKKHSFLSDFFSSSIFMSPDGRVVAKSDESTKDHINRQQILCRNITLTVSACILPALHQLLLEHTVTRQSIYELCYYSPVVPQGREKQLSEALFHGFEYNFDTVIHLICPQFEHLFRCALKKAGAVTTHIDQNNCIEDELSLNSLVDMPEALSLWGEDILMNIKTVFTESAGFNLRNNVAHGLLSDDQANSRESVYAWWLVLKIIILSLAEREDKEFSKGEASEHSGSST